MARIYFGEANIVNKKISVLVYVDSEGESVNAYDVKIKFSNNLIFRDWNSANSIINFWLEKPSVQTIISRTNANYIIKRELMRTDDMMRTDTNYIIKRELMRTDEETRTNANYIIKREPMRTDDMMRTDTNYLIKRELMRTDDMMRTDTNYIINRELMRIDKIRTEMNFSMNREHVRIDNSSHKFASNNDVRNSSHLTQENSYKFTVNNNVRITSQYNNSHEFAVNNEVRISSYYNSSHKFAFNNDVRNSLHLTQESSHKFAVDNNIHISSYSIKNGSHKFASNDNIIQFSGVSIGGYIGRKGLLVELIFEPRIYTEEIVLEVLPSSKVLLNDGSGTEAKLRTDKKIFKISKLKTAEAIVDNYPPESFKIFLYRNKEIFNGKYFILFQTTDKQSGIAYYEVAEKQGFLKPDTKDLNFERTESPYILKDQTLRSYIFVKAVDKAGNERIEYLKPKNLLSFDEVFSALLFGVLVFLLIKLIYKRWKLIKRE